MAGPLPFGRAVAVEFANAFSALAGGTAAVFATRVRFFQKQGYDTTVALSSGAIMAAVQLDRHRGAVRRVAAVRLGVHPPRGHPRNPAATRSWSGSSWPSWWRSRWRSGWLLAVPRLRRLAASKLRPKVRDIWGNLRQVASSPRKLVLLVGGSFAQELLVAMALSVSLRAFGDHLRLPTLIVVISLAGIIGGISPTPGGMGVVEAGLILGLTAAGVAEADATAAVFIQRLFTSYLPPIWGWVTLVWMRKREYL